MILEKYINYIKLCYAFAVDESESILGVSSGVYMFNTLPSLGNEFIHAIFSVSTAVTSAYIIHRLKLIWEKKKEKKNP